jgi:hypothetical protein
VLRLVAVALATLLTLSACADDTVRVAFRPAAGARYAYEVEVEATTVTEIEGRAPVRETERFVLDVEHDVLAADGDSRRVEVRVRVPGGEQRRFVVRLDRAAQLAEVQRIEGLPAQALGSLGLSEIFPAAAGAPPDRPLAPGDRWRVDDPVELPGQERTRLRGSGRLAALGVVAGREVATIENRFDLTVRGTSELSLGRFRLDGRQTTASTASHDLADGAVENVEAVTRGRFRLTLLPPDGTDGPEIPGTLRIEIRSQTRRLS